MSSFLKPNEFPYDCHFKFSFRHVTSICFGQISGLVLFRRPRAHVWLTSPVSLSVYNSPLPSHLFHPIIHLYNRLFFRQFPTFWTQLNTSWWHCLTCYSPVCFSKLVVTPQHIVPYELFTQWTYGLLIIIVYTHFFLEITMVIFSSIIAFDIYQHFSFNYFVTLINSLYGKGKINAGFLKNCLLIFKLKLVSQQPPKFSSYHKRMDGFFF